MRRQSDPLVSMASGHERKVAAVAIDEQLEPLLTKDVSPRYSALDSLYRRFGVVLIIAYYALCSSTMLIINKVTIHYLPSPVFILLCQLGTSAVVVWVGDKLGLLQSEPLVWSKLQKFILVVLAFVGVIFANMKTLQYSNVETFITFRSSIPIVISICDYIFLGRELPSLRSWACLLSLLVGAAGYVLTDSSFQVRGYMWLAVWYVAFTVDAVYIKYVCDTVDMTAWGRVFYTNFLAVLPLAIAFPIVQEHKNMAKVDWKPISVGPLLLSCVGGLGMSHSTYLLRAQVSATAFTLVGIVCKIFTVIINCLIWDKHASPEGIAFLMVCVIASSFYEQAPKRKQVTATHWAAKPVDAESKVAKAVS